MSARPRLRLPAKLGAALAFLSLSLIAGCGPALGDVTGKVYYKGKAVTSGFVTMISSDGVVKFSEIAEDGSYRIAQVPVGEARVAVRSPAADSAMEGRPLPKRDVPLANQQADTALLTEYQLKTWRPIPINYSDITKSALRHTVTPGANSKDFNID
jgi:hypothetical protein